MTISSRTACVVRLVIGFIGVTGISGVRALAQSAELRVTADVLRDAQDVPPLGTNGWGRSGAVEWAANNFVRNSGNEPIWWRNLHRVQNCGPGWFEIDGPGTSWYDLWASGFLSGADLRVYRLVDRAGQPLEERDGYLAIDQADHVQFVGATTILPEGAAGFPDGGWVASTYSTPYPNAWIRHGNLSVTDAAGLENGRSYWYTVVALDAEGRESPHSNEIQATPLAGHDTPPHILIAGNDDRLPSLRTGEGFHFAPALTGGQPPFHWEALDALPAGLILDPTTGTVSGTITQAPAPVTTLRLRVTDARGRSVDRAYTLNSAAAAEPARTAAADSPLEPPLDLSAQIGDGCVTLSWKPSPSPRVVAYRLMRSTAPAAAQVQRVYCDKRGPTLRRWDYIVVSKRLQPFDMKYVNPRVRGIGNPFDAPEWYWRRATGDAAFSLVDHPQPIPSRMIDPGSSCLRIDAGDGPQRVEQFVFIGTEIEGEALWYGQLEPDQHYRLEVWLRQENLGHDGAVTFSYGPAYPQIAQTFQVDGLWRKYTYDFEGPDRPRDSWHFGHGLSFEGPGSLWMDNARICRVDQPGDAAQPYVPNATVLAELLASQPAGGPKGTHRIWFLARDATMDSIMSWHANSQVRPDWRTAVDGTMDMTLPMGLSFDLATGADPASRMRPWLVLQHILHSEDDWKNLVEFLAAPYDPTHDTPASKPVAYRRYQQRGTGTPWIDEFEQITLEFGNETWHNGHFEDWLGFNRYNAIWQGGPEYGLFCQYLIDTMKASPYWSEAVDRKLRFCLGAGYNGKVESDGRVTGYGEEAIQNGPGATALGHANYVGPKWETGDATDTAFNDRGVQATLLGFLAGPEPQQIEMGRARDAIARGGHDYDIVAYEGGPSGYALPGSDAPEQREANERYGKSLAMAVAALDAWMRSYAYGWTDQNFLGYGQGTHWNSHTPLWDGFRPSPGWQALCLRNRHAAGDLMRVEEVAVPTITWDQAPYPLIGVYVLRQGPRWSVFVVSRRLNRNEPDDGHTPVTLRLPFPSARSITLHTLTGDPRDSNREELQIEPATHIIAPALLRDGVFSIDENTGGDKAGMPPGSIYLYVFESRSD